jgi:hypothetical protein
VVAADDGLPMALTCGREVQLTSPPFEGVMAERGMGCARCREEAVKVTVGGGNDGKV